MFESDPPRLLEREKVPLPVRSMLVDIILNYQKETDVVVADAADGSFAFF